MGRPVVGGTQWESLPPRLAHRREEEVRLKEGAGDHEENVNIGPRRACHSRRGLSSSLKGLDSFSLLDLVWLWIRSRHISDP